MTLDAAEVAHEFVVSEAVAGPWSLQLVELSYTDGTATLAVRASRGNEATRERRFTGVSRTHVAMAYYGMRIAMADVDAELGR